MLATLACIACIFAVLVIYAYHKDIRSFRDQILLGMFLSNIVFSISNIIPTGLVLDEDGVECGFFALSPLTVAVGNALFWFGKYQMVFFEIFIVVMSVLALKYGSTSLDYKRTFAVYLALMLLPMIVFVTYIVLILPKFEKDDNTSFINGNITLAHKLRSLENNDANDLEAILFRLWLPFLFIVIIVWGFSRVILHWNLNSWGSDLADAEETWNREYADESDPALQQVRQRQRKLLDLQKFGWLEVARPLEPYVMVFIVFSIPAIVTATDYCINRSLVGMNTPCNMVAQMVLSMRSLATASVFFFEKHRRREAFDIKGLVRKSWARLSATLFCAPQGLRFRGTIHVQEYNKFKAVSTEDDDDDGDIEDERQLNIAYTLMGGST